MRHYNALATAGSDAATTRARHSAVNWMNQMFATEPIVNFDVNKLVMVDFYFTEEQFAGGQQCVLPGSGSNELKEMVAWDAPEDDPD